MHESAGAREVARSAMTNSESRPEPLRLGGRQRPAQPLPAGSLLASAHRAVESAADCSHCIQCSRRHDGARRGRHRAAESCISSGEIEQRGEVTGSERAGPAASAADLLEQRKRERGRDWGRRGRAQEEERDTGVHGEASVVHRQTSMAKVRCTYTRNTPAWPDGERVHVTSAGLAITISWSSSLMHNGHASLPGSLTMKKKIGWRNWARDEESSGLYGRGPNHDKNQYNPCEVENEMTYL